MRSTVIISPVSGESCLLILQNGCTNLTRINKINFQINFQPPTVDGDSISVACFRKKTVTTCPYMQLAPVFPTNDSGVGGTIGEAGRETRPVTRFLVSLHSCKYPEFLRCKARRKKSWPILTHTGRRCVVIVDRRMSPRWRCGAKLANTEESTVTLKYLGST